MSQLQSLNAKLEEDLLASEHAGSRMIKPGNGHDPDDSSQPGFGKLLSAPGERQRVVLTLIIMNCHFAQPSCRFAVGTLCLVNSNT